jgi:hypothetical protein
MALTLSTSGITNSGTIQAAHVSQSIDALKGTHAYDLTPSGSINLTGSMNYRYKTEAVVVASTDTLPISISTKPSGTTFIITNTNNDSTSNQLRFDVPAAASTVAGTHFKFLISQIGADTAIGVAVNRPILFKGTAADLMPRIIDGSSGLYSTTNPDNGVLIDASRYSSGDSFEAICDGIYWHITGQKRIAGGLS